MAQIVSEVTKIRRKVLKEVASLLFNNQLVAGIESIPQKIIADGVHSYRCCQYKEKAILRERIKLALGVNPANYPEEITLREIAAEVLAHDRFKPTPPFIYIIEEACDHCSIDKIIVTNACRNCVAHSCVNTCPRDAITIVGNQAFIEREKCIECGLCIKACSYRAIIEIERPCNRSCSVEAIVPGEKSTVRINYDSCLGCAACTVACPFGAISFKSEITTVFKMLSNPGEQVVALLAPSLIGQFGLSINENILAVGLKKLGFADTYLVAEGADQVIREEGAELRERIEEKNGIMFNSCCPSFKQLVHKHFPALIDHISTTESPMLKIARRLREDRQIKTVFIGPCISKKVEAYEEGQGLIDAVLTFEEITALLVGAGINLAEIPEKASAAGPYYQSKPSNKAENFCRAGGVGAAIKQEIGQDDLRIESADGIEACIQALNKVKNRSLKADFLEGMGCQGGCIGGPGTLIKPQVARRLLTKKEKS